MPRTGDPASNGDSVANFGRLLTSARSGNGPPHEVLIGECRDYLSLIANEGLDRGLQATLGASDHVQETLHAAHRNLVRTVFTPASGRSG